MLTAVIAVGTTGCDAGPEQDQGHLNGSAIHLVDVNVGAKPDGGVNPPLPVDGRIEVSFDRFLLPQSVSRQTFILQDAQGNFLSPSPAYDPAARVVTLTATTVAFVADQAYTLRIVPPANADDANGLRAADGTPLGQPISLSFLTAGGDAGAGAPQMPPPSVDFCADVFPVFRGTCTTPGTCHAPQTAQNIVSAEGLLLDSTAGIQATAIGVPAHESNTGTSSVAQEPGAMGRATTFANNMFIVDPGNGGAGGNPANSWLLYKLLLAQPNPPSSNDPMGISMATAHLVATQDASDTERAALGDLMQGREMPFPTPGVPSAALTDAQLEAVSLWISEVPPTGQIVPACP